METTNNTNSLNADVKSKKVLEFNEYKEFYLLGKFRIETEIGVVKKDVNGKEIRDPNGKRVFEKKKKVKYSIDYEGTPLVDIMYLANDAVIRKVASRARNDSKFFDSLDGSKVYVKELITGKRKLSKEQKALNTLEKLELTPEQLQEVIEKLQAKIEKS